jgi:tetratricopeptide (TPR) repeat protein
MMRACLAAALSLVLAAPAGAAATATPEPSAAWLSPDWAVRRLVEAKVDAPHFAGSEVAVCEFFHGGLAKADGSDIRVAVVGTKLVKHRVLQTGPGDFVRVAFAASREVSRYYVYYGNPKAPAPEAWEPQRGVLLEARRWPGGRSDRLDQVQAVWARAAPLGADFVSHVSFGYNPFGESDVPAVFHFTGWFSPPASGTYTVDISSNGGSWLFIDGKEVVSWPGPHPPTSHSRHAQEIVLTPGLHRLDFWNVNQGPFVATTMVAAWELPRTGHFEPISPKAFAPVVQASLVQTDMPGERLVADFFAKGASEAWWPDQYAVRMQFKNLSKGFSPTQGARLEWDFGDGQKSTVADPTHIYLAAGDYAVTLKCSRLADSSTFRTKVRVERNWWKQVDPPMEPVRRYADEVARYDLAALDLRNLLAAVSLFEHEGLSQPIVAAIGELLKRRDLDEGQVPRLALLLGENLRKAGQAEQAVASYRQLEARIRRPPAKAEIAVQAGETLLRDLQRFDEAEKEYQRLLKTYATSGAEAVFRRAHIGLGDIWRHRGDGDKARHEYSAAAAGKTVAYTPKEAAVRVGTLARYVEEYTREKQWEWAFKFIDDWGWEFPGDRLQGHWSYLKAGALVAKGDKRAALAEAMDLVGANPSSAYAVRLLMLAAECQIALGQPDKARLLLQTAVEDYPEDPDQAKARTRLLALGGPIGDSKGGPKAAPGGAAPAPPAGPAAPPRPPAPAAKK